MDFELSDEQRMWRETIRGFCDQEVAPQARHVDETGEFNWGAVRKMGPLGLLGLNIPEEFGGPGVDPICAALHRGTRPGLWEHRPGDRGAQQSGMRSIGPVWNGRAKEKVASRARPRRGELGRLGADGARGRIGSSWRHSNPSPSGGRRVGHPGVEDVVHECQYCRPNCDLGPDRSDRRVALVEPNPCSNPDARIEDRLAREEDGVAWFPHPRRHVR